MGVTNFDIVEANHFIGVETGGGLSATIGVVGSDADYETDGTADDVQINAALVAVSAAGGGTILLKAGTYNCDALVKVTGNIVFEGEGEATVLNFRTSLSALAVLGVNNVKIRNLKVTNTSVASPTASSERAVMISNSQNVELSHCHIEGYHFGIFSDARSGAFNGYVYTVQDCKRIWIHHNYVRNYGRQDTIGGGRIDVATSPDIYDFKVEDNYVVNDAGSNTGDINAFDMVNAYRLSVSRNVFEGAVYFGNEKDPHQYSVISNNIIRPAANTTTTMSGITVQDDNQTVAVSGKLLISNNVLYGGAIHLVGNSGQTITNVEIIGNIIHNNPSLTTNDQTNTLSQKGIWLQYADKVLVNGNHCYGPSVTADGIVIQNSVNCSVVGNYVDGYANSLTESGTVTGGFWSNNYLINYSTSPVSSITKNAFNNLGLNPQQLFAQANVTGATTFTRVNGNVIMATLTGNITTTLTAGKVLGDELTLILTQDGTGGRTISKPANAILVGGAFSPSAGAGAVDSWTFVWNGTAWQEKARSLNLT